MATPLQEFLIKLGFQIDQGGLRKFNESITTTGHIVRDFAGALTGMAVAAEEAVRRTARQFENLFYLSQQTGVSANNLKQWRFAFEQVGLSAADAGNTLTGVAASLRDNPGLRGLAQQIAPGFKTSADVLDGFAKRYRALMDQFGEDTPQVDAAAIPIRRMAELFGISAEQLRQLALNYRETQEARVQMQKSLTAFGFTSLDEASKNATDLGRTLNRVWKDFGIAFDRFITESFPAVNGLLKDFADWLETDGAKKVREWGKEWDAWIKRVEAWFKSDEGKQRLSELKDGAISLGSAILEVGKAFIALSDKIGPLQALAVTVFGVVLAKAVATTLAVDALALSFGTLQAAILAIGTSSVVAALAPIMAFLAAMTLFSKPAAPKAEGEVEKRLGDEANRRRLGAPPIPNAPPVPGAPTQAEVDKAYQDANARNEEKARELEASRRRFRGEAEPQVPATATIPQTITRGLQRRLFHRTSYEEGGDTGGGFGGISFEELLLRGFTSWWSGAASFRPIVTIADEFFDKLRELLENVFFPDRNKAAPGGGATGAGAGGGAGGGGAGGRRMVGRLGGMGPRLGGGGGGGGGGGAEHAPLPNNVFEAISQAEGTFAHGAINYNDALLHGAYAKPSKPISEMTLDEVDALQTQMLANPKNKYHSSAIGAFQIIRTTLRDMRRKLPGLTGDTKFSPEVQRRLATGIWHRQGSPAWEGFKTHPALRALAERSAASGAGFTDAAGTSGTTGAGAAGAGMPSGTGNIDAVLGDSLAVGLAKVGHLPSDAIGGTTPQQIYQRISAHIQDFAGKTVGLASGSNPNAGFDEKQMGFVRKTMEALHKAGAHVVLAGVGSGVKDFVKINKRLGEYANEFHDPFSGVPATTQGGIVHPRNYMEMLKQMQRSNQINSDHNTTINIHSMTDDPHGHARVIKDIQGRQSALHTRNLRAAMV